MCEGKFLEVYWNFIILGVGDEKGSNDELVNI